MDILQVFMVELADLGWCLWHIYRKRQKWEVRSGKMFFFFVGGPFGNHNCFSSAIVVKNDVHVMLLVGAVVLYLKNDIIGSTYRKNNVVTELITHNLKWGQYNNTFGLKIMSFSILWRLKYPR
ncbi:hypothetical protein ACJX0J_034312 [Zea mays]